MAHKSTKQVDSKRYKFDLVIWADIHIMIPARFDAPFSTHFPTGQEITARIRNDFEENGDTDISVQDVSYIVVIVSCYDDSGTKYMPISYAVDPALVWPVEFPYDSE